MKLWPKLGATVFAAASLVLASGVVRAERIDNAEKSMKLGKSKPGLTTSVNKMGKASGHQPHKKTPGPSHIEESSFPVEGGLTIGSKGSGTKEGKAPGVGEIDVDSLAPSKRPKINGK